MNGAVVSCFPDPYPDELFYGICERFQQRMQYPSQKSTIQKLFGKNYITVSIDLPNRLGYLVSALPSGNCYTVNYIIDNYTLLPFYSPFLPRERVEQIRQEMEKGNGLLVHLRAGASSSSIHSPDWLRYCPACLREDRQQFGESYWHRLHQISGVEVCLIHNVFLENSTARGRGRQVRYKLASIEQTVQSLSLRPLSSSNGVEQILLKIAQDAAWLLNQKNFRPGLKSIRDRYIKLLIDRGLATYTGQVRTQQLTEALKEYYSPELLKLLQCEIREGDYNAWFLRLVRLSKCSCHPLYHLLLIQFLGCTVEEFFQLPSKLKPFGDGPWPCLNPVCPCFQQLCIQTFELKHDKTHGGRLTATFSCECGFVYSRMGPDTSPEDLFKVGKIKARGQIWEASLEELWENSTVTLTEIAKRLGADSQSVKYHAVRLNLIYPRPGPTARQTRKTVMPQAETMKVEPPKLVEYRNEWLEIVQNNPDAGRSKLAAQHRRVHSWLSFYDQEWLYNHLPPLKNRPLALAQIDWQQRDTEISIAVRVAAKQLRDKPGKPEKITKTAIASNSGYLALIQRQLDKLPLTAKRLSDVIETTEEFAVRRVQWTAERYRQEGIYPKKWQIVRETGIKPYIAEMPKVKEAIASVLALLELRINSPDNLPSKR